MTEVYIEGLKADIYDDIPMPFTYSIADIFQPEKRNTSFSKTVILPGTKRNDAIFSNIFSVSKELINSSTLVNYAPEFNPLLKAKIKVFTDTNRVFTGIVQLTDIKRNGNAYDYEVVMYGSLKNIFLNIEGLYLTDLDFSEYTHEFTRARMVESWATKIQKNGIDYVNFAGGLPKGEGYVYPVIDYGYSNVGPKKENTYPAIYLREYMVKIFQYAGFTWDSNFFDSQLFKNLIVVGVPSEPKNLSDAEITKRSVQASLSSAYTGAYSKNPLLREDDIPIDNDSTGGNFDNYPAYRTSAVAPYYGPAIAWVVPVTGTYKITATVDSEVEGTTDSTNSFYRIRATNSVWPTQRVTLAESNDKSILTTNTDTVTAPAVALKKGQVVWVSVCYRASPLSSGDNKRIKVNSAVLNIVPVSAPTFLGQEMDVNSCVPKILIKDLFNSVLRMFNLYIQPDQENDTILKIEPQVDFQNDNAIDWSSKVDYDKEINIKPAANVDAKNFVFKYKEDGDYWNKKYKEDYTQGYGDYSVTAINDFVKGDKLTELIFSATPTVRLPGTGIDVPQIVNADEEGVLTPFKPNIRILQWGGIKSGFWNWDADNGNITSEFDYLFTGHLNSPTAPTFDLNWSVPKEIYFGSPGLPYTTNNLYNKYWLQFISEITDPDSKLVTMYIKFSPLDIFNLDFRRPVYIDGVNYRLNKIIDYDPLKTDSVKTELIKLKRGFVFQPDTEDVITSDDPTKFDILEGGLNEVRSLNAITNITVVDGGRDAVINFDDVTNIDIINGG